MLLRVVLAQRGVTTCTYEVCVHLLDPSVHPRAVFLRL